MDVVFVGVLLALFGLMFVLARFCEVQIHKQG